MINKKCIVCGKDYKVSNCHKDKSKYCSYACYWKSKKKPNPEQSKKLKE